MKYVALLVALFAVAEAFAPAPNGRSATSLDAKKTFFQSVFEMDLFAPVSDQNDYGARSKKNLKVGKITEKSYVPAGLSKSQYEKIRSGDAQKKADKYSKNVAKAGKFVDFTAWYAKRGTDTQESWAKGVTKGHTMVKTKYDWSGLGDKKLWAKEEK